MNKGHKKSQTRRPEQQVMPNKELLNLAEMAGTVRAESVRRVAISPV
jgi:hypothetical protein